MAFGAGTIVVVLIFLAVSGDFLTAAYLAVGLFAGLFALSLAIVFALSLAYGGGIDAKFYIVEKGVGYELGKSFKKTNRATLLVSLMGRSPTATGALLVGSSREAGFVSWGEVRSITVHSREKVIYMRRKQHINPVALFCTPDNFEEAVALVSRYAPMIRIEAK
ncbi:MAG: hypothetical protein QFX35_02865 [Candidatus Verstraetearchaeota archaeon]|nr:hypothetical protein [Candidatus Verstraetearchaeota archaeon]